MKTIIDRLYTLGSQLLTKRNMPSEHEGDYKFCKSTAIRDRRMITSLAANANDQCRVWGIEVRSIIDRLNNIKTCPAHKHGEKCAWGWVDHELQMDEICQKEPCQNVRNK